MKNTLRWSWPILLAVLVLLVPWMIHDLRPSRVLDVAVLDKTVPFEDRIEHRSLFWLLNYLKIVKPDGAGYDRDRDYLGSFPGPVPGDPPARTVDLTSERARRADLVYLADTYGVYRKDLESGPAMKAALERSPAIYGGLTLAEAEAARAALASGKTLIAEFNTLGSPTGSEARATLEGALGVRWTRWIGRYFGRLEDREEVPEWLRRDYEREWGRRWEFTGPGYVLLQDDDHCEVLRVGVESPRVALRLEHVKPSDPVLEDSSDGTSYPYWFDVVEAAAGTEVLASFRWHLEPAGLARLAARKLPQVFPAVTRRRAPGRGAAWYFAGDFADNPMPDGPVPFAGYLAARRWIEALKLSPSELEFYWRFYAPMMARLIEGVPRR
ncbi:MAG: hypothetical protein LAO51_07485 [Acidobacteriia bacterium]|nr:hypothetical protein [Terriglobia bacterium]